MSSADRLFETLDPTTRSYDYLGRTYLLTDTVGFVRKLPHQLVAAFASTLEETLLADLILHVADASADEEERDRQIASVETRARRDRRLGAAAPARAQQGRPLQRGGAPAAAQPAARCRARSALHGEGLLDIERAIGEHFAGRFEHVALLVPFDQGGVLAELYALGSPIEREDTAEGVLIRAHLPHALAERYASFRLVPTGA